MVKSYDLTNLIVRKYSDDGKIIVFNPPEDMVENMLIDFVFFVDYKHRRMEANIHSYEDGRLILKDYNFKSNNKKTKRR